jgi:uncharacterized membrane protein YfcA
MNVLVTIGWMLALGAVAGVLGGLFGIGGGLVIVPALVLGYGLDQKTATGTSLFALLWPVGLLGVWEYWRRGELRADYGAWIALGLLVGILVGARMTRPMSAGLLKRAYGMFLLILGVYYLLGSQGRATPAPSEPPAQVQRPPERS